MYRSPIDIIYADISSCMADVAKKVDEDIWQAIVRYDVNIDKDELIRALQYDRDQYAKGYADGEADATPRWISVEERLPTEEDANEEGLVLVRNFGCPQYEAMDWDQVKMFRSMISNWMHLPEPPKEDDHGKTLE